MPKKNNLIGSMRSSLARPKSLWRVLTLLSLIPLTSCSVQFRQLDMLNQIREANTDPLEGLAWNMDWNGESYTLYAATEGDETLFGGYGDLLLGFDGYDLTDVIGFLPNDDIGRVELQENDLVYFVNDQFLSRHICQPWDMRQLADGSIKFTRSCEDEESRLRSEQGRSSEPYQNQFDISPDGELSRMHFLLHPDYPAMTMTPLEDPS